MNLDNFDIGDEKQLLKGFREVAKSHAKIFKVKKDHAKILLKNKHHLSSGIFREGLLKDVLRDLLPTAVSIDSGFVYGFEDDKNSKQLDIIIWDSLRHSPIYRTKDFVVLPPEAVIAVIEVKSRLNKKELIEGLINLTSLTSLDLKYKYSYAQKNPEVPEWKPIFRFLVFYETALKKNETILNIISSFYKDLFLNNDVYSEYLSDIMNKMRKLKVYELPKEIDNIFRIFPVHICSLNSPMKSFSFDMGPNFSRYQPHVYPQNKKITIPFEKMIYYLLRYIYPVYNVKGIQTLSAWFDIDPKIGARSGNIPEMLDEEAVSLFDNEDFYKG